MKKTQFKTYDNSTAPIKDNITKTSFKMTFSKSNFMFIGKWIIAFVLIIVFGSQALNGFISSKFTKDSTTETIVHEYKKQIGTEIVGGDFDFIAQEQSLNSLLDKKIYIQKNKEVIYDLNQFGGSIGSQCLFRGYFRLEAYKDDLLVTRIGSMPQDFGIFYFNYIVIDDNVNFNYYSYDDYTNTNDIDYFIIRQRSTTTEPFYPLDNPTVASNYQVITNFMNYYFTFGDTIEIPIYETTTYTYEVRDNNYNWDTKLKQLSAFKPLFKFNQSFINEEYLKYNNLISYEFVDTQASRENLVNQYKLDERLKPLFDNNYITIGGKTESGLFKDKTKYYSFIEFISPLDYGIDGVSSAYNWVIDNYVTYFNIDSYLNESKYKVELKDLLEIFKFPIQIVNNLVYDFGVLIGFITWW